MSFDFGAEPVVGGGSLKQATEGQHEARLLGLVHLGMYADVFKGKAKDPAPFVCALLELKSGEEGGGLNEDGTPIIVHRSFPLKKGDKAYLTKFLKVFLSVEEFKQYEAGLLQGSFDDFIGKALMVDMVGSKAKGDDGNPKYTNVGDITKMHAKLEKLCDDLENPPVGHVTLDKMTEGAMKHLPPFEIYGKLEKSINFPGSQAEEVLNKLREEDPEFATEKEKEGGDDKGSAKAPPEQKRTDLDESEDFS